MTNAVQRCRCQNTIAPTSPFNVGERILFGFFAKPIEVSLSRLSVIIIIDYFKMRKNKIARLKQWVIEVPRLPLSISLPDSAANAGLLSFRFLSLFMWLCVCCVCLYESAIDGGQNMPEGNIQTVFYSFLPFVFHHLLRRNSSDVCQHRSHFQHQPQYEWIYWTIVCVCVGERQARLERKRGWNAQIYISFNL